MTTIHCNSHIGLTMQNVTVTEHHSANGQHYFKATQPIGSIFGSSVEGECKGIGRTREEALERLAKDVHNLSESLWA